MERFATRITSTQIAIRFIVQMERLVLEGNHLLRLPNTSSRLYMYSKNSTLSVLNTSNIIVLGSYTIAVYAQS